MRASGWAACSRAGRSKRPSSSRHFGRSGLSGRATTPRLLPHLLLLLLGQLSSLLAPTLLMDLSQPAPRPKIKTRTVQVEVS